MRLIRRSFEILYEEGFLAFIRRSVVYISQTVSNTYYQIGSSKTCPICGWEGYKFFSYGVKQRSDAACPQCDSKERHRILWEYLSREHTFKNSADILYFAPTSGLENKFREMNSISLTTTDLVRTDVSLRSDIVRLPFLNESFDLIICSHVLEHVPDDDVALDELYRTLRKGGTAIILVPQDRDLAETYEDLTITEKKNRREAFGQSDHVRWYGRDVQNILASAGFDVRVIDYKNKLEADYIDRCGLSENEEWIHSPTQIFVCTKPQ